MQIHFISSGSIQGIIAALGEENEVTYAITRSRTVKDLKGVRERVDDADIVVWVPTDNVIHFELGMAIRADKPIVMYAMESAVPKALPLPIRDAILCYVSETDELCSFMKKYSRIYREQDKDKYTEALAKLIFGTGGGE